MYVLGDASLVAPVLLFQLVGVTPVALTVLDLASGGEKRPLWRRLLTPLRNPIAVGSLAGVAVSASGPHGAGARSMDPVTLIGNMSVPAVLLAFGISLCGSTMPAAGPGPGPGAPRGGPEVGGPARGRPGPWRRASSACAVPCCSTWW